jgi:hypothetical protein
MYLTRPFAALTLSLAMVVSFGVGAAAAASPAPRPVAPGAPITTPTPTPTPTPIPAPWTGAINVYRAGAFVTQKNAYWCVGASSQMMLNIINRTSDASYATQAGLIAYARAHEIEPSSKPGSDPRGWANALTHARAGTYTDNSFTSMDAALAYAAKRIRLTGKPVGLTVGFGSHAWVMTGFVANRDPLVSSNYTVSAVYVSGPLYPMQVAKLGYFDLKPNSRLSRAQMTQVFLPYRETQGLRGWLGKWVIVAP